jgi:cbb3-type cytochrome oxidase subunit 1
MSSQVWKVYSKDGILVRTFTGTQAMLQAQDLARVVGGTAHCTN